MYYVYVLQSKLNGEIYTGSSNDLKKRFQEHNDGKVISTKRHKPWKLIYYEAYESEELARMREKRLKHNGNAMKELKKRIGFSVKELKSGVGFTLIELLIVIAILGVLAAGVLVALDPLEQLAKGRDGSRKTVVSQLSKAMQNYYVFNSKYPPANSTWTDALVSSGELKIPPSEISNSNKCTTDISNGIYEVNGYCYKVNTDQTSVVLYSKLESKAVCAGSSAYFLWSSADGQSGTYCSLTQPARTDPGFYSYDGNNSPNIPGNGGIITTSGGDTIHTFTASGIFTPPTGGVSSVQVLVVAGGGGGVGCYVACGAAGPGGGAGGLIYNASYAVTPATPVSVTIGDGGLGSAGGAGETSGTNSVFGTLTVFGGGAGGNNNGVNGGSGGGSRFGGAIGLGVPGQGNSGGLGTTDTENGGGGGGGGGIVGSPAFGPNGGNGGSGLASSISGASVIYAGGGGGSVYGGGVPGNGGAGGGGNAGKDTNGSNGIPNTGGGGGGAGRSGPGPFNGGNGGSGIVIVRYQTP